MTVPAERRGVVVVHSSDEMYGSDRMLLEVVDALLATGTPVEVWLPTDLDTGLHDVGLARTGLHDVGLAHTGRTLCGELQRRRSVVVRHLDLPILRRALLRPRGLVRLIRSGARLQREIRRSRPLVVHCATSACLLAAPAARLTGVPVVSLHVQEIWTGVEARVLRALARCTTFQITISRAVDDAARLRSSTVVENCRPDPDDVEVGPGSGIADRSGPLHFVIASRWNRWKGHRTLLEAWSRAGCPGRLTVLGGAPPSGDAVDVPQLVPELLGGRTSGGAQTVHVVGEVDDIGAHLAAADVLVLPSDQPEPFGLVMIEAFAHGRPVIASRAGGPLEVITDGSDGWTFPPGDTGALAALLGTLDRATVAAAGRRARTTFEQRFIAERYRQRVGELFAAAVSEPTSRNHFGSATSKNPVLATNSAAYTTANPPDHHISPSARHSSP